MGRQEARPPLCDVEPPCAAFSAWEIWNEPDLSIETPCHPADWSAALTPKAYLTMWNAVVPQMRAVDPAIKLVGPTGGVNTGYTPDYIPTLMASSTYKPDVVSYHGYGGWDNSQGDLEIFDGGPDTDGLASIVNGVDQVRAWAPGKPRPIVGGTRQIPYLLDEDRRLK